MLGRIEDLLLLAKLDEGRPLQLQPVRLDVLAADAVRDALAVEPGQSISCHAEAVEIIGDESRLRQVLANPAGQRAGTRRPAPRSRSSSTPTARQRSSRWPTTDPACAPRSPDVPSQPPDHPRGIEGRRSTLSTVSMTSAQEQR